FLGWKRRTREGVRGTVVIVVIPIVAANDAIEFWKKQC
ncbi:hypothetical protein A2U01_0072746, partial [Trifolium medium]|nr:hypothetical protein [Trifolium medium]